MAARPKPLATTLPDNNAARIEALAGEVRLLRAIVSELAESNAQLRRAAGFDPARPTIDATTPWRSIKQISSATGFSQSQVRKLIKQDRLVAVKCGGKIFIDTSASLPGKPTPR